AFFPYATSTLEFYSLSLHDALPICDHALVTEEVHCGIQALTRRGVAPMPEGREQSIAAHRAPGLLQGREDVFNRLEGRIGPGFRISRPGDSCGSRHGSHYMYPYSICILPPWMRN